ncbi:unnamed protein product, partial [marine sediment metagenome]
TDSEFSFLGLPIFADIFRKKSFMQIYVGFNL